MDIQPFIKICVILTIIGVNYVLSLPTFGNEYVHIKVHIPHETSNSKAVLKSKHPVSHHSPNHHHHHVRHKVIHHYHHVRKPVKKIPIKETAPLLENIYLAELDKSQHSPQHHGPKHIEETYLVKEEHHHSKPIEEVKTIKIIKEYEHHPKPQPHLEYAKNNVKTIKIIETANDVHQHHHHVEDHGHHVETVKLVEEKPQQLQHHHLEDHDHHVETVKFVENNKQPQYHHHYQQENQYQVPKDEILNVVQAPKYTSIVQNHGHGNYAHEPQVEEVIEEEQNYHDNKNYDPEDQLLHGIIEESIEIIKSKKAKNHNYQTYYGFHPPKDQQKTQYQATPYKQQPEVTIEQHIEYDKPSSGHNFVGHQHYGPPKKDKPIISFVPHQHYGAPEQDDYDNANNHYALHQQYGPPKPDTPESVQKYSQSSANYQQDSYGDKQNFAMDYQQYLPSSESPPDFNVKQNTLYDDLNPKDDFSNAVENPQAPETYTGYDSYSAGHVQGLGSGGYRHHTP